jgi:hypothetical protein
MDMKTTFLIESWMRKFIWISLMSFFVKGEEQKVCKLLKSLYGFKEAPKQWHEKFNTTLTSAGFAVNEADRCVYYRHGGANLLYNVYILMIF